MKKIVLWLMSTLTVVVLLFGYHTSTSGVSSATSPPAVYSGTSTSTSSGTSGTSSGTSSDVPSTDTSTDTGTGTSTGTSTAATTVTGSVAQTQWGPVQVELTIANSSITQVDVLQSPSGNPRDTEINNQALPILIQETLDGQSAQIDMVSGATVTSDGYLTSLQSALDQANL